MTIVARLVAAALVGLAGPPGAALAEGASAWAEGFIPGRAWCPGAPPGPSIGPAWRSSSTGATRPIGASRATGAPPPLRLGRLHQCRRHRRALAGTDPDGGPGRGRPHLRATGRVSREGASRGSGQAGQPAAHAGLRGLQGDLHPGPGVARPHPRDGGRRASTDDRRGPRPGAAAAGARSRGTLVDHGGRPVDGREADLSRRGALARGRDAVRGGARELVSLDLGGPAGESIHGHRGGKALWGPQARSGCG